MALFFANSKYNLWRGGVQKSKAGAGTDTEIRSRARLLNTHTHTHVETLRGRSVGRA